MDYRFTQVIAIEIAFFVDNLLALLINLAGFNEFYKFNDNEALHHFRVFLKSKAI